MKKSLPCTSQLLGTVIFENLVLIFILWDSEGHFISMCSRSVFKRILEGKSSIAIDPFKLKSLHGLPEWLKRISLLLQRKLGARKGIFVKGFAGHEVPTTVY